MIMSIRNIKEALVKKLTINGEPAKWETVDDNNISCVHYDGVINVFIDEGKAIYKEENGFWVRLPMFGCNIVSNISEIKQGCKK